MIYFFCFSSGCVNFETSHWISFWRFIYPLDFRRGTVNNACSYLFTFFMDGRIHLAILLFLKRKLAHLNFWLLLKRFNCALLMNYEFNIILKPVSYQITVAIFLVSGESFPWRNFRIIRKLTLQSLSQNILPTEFSNRP